VQLLGLICSTTHALLWYLSAQTSSLLASTLTLCDMKRLSSPVWDIENEGASLPSDGTSGLEDESDNGNPDNFNIYVDNQPKTPKHEQDTFRGSKCKANMMEQITEITKSEHQNRFKIASVNANSKTHHAIEK
jgi:hypothetical protein